jgi:hypothetical protein
MLPKSLVMNIPRQKRKEKERRGKEKGVEKEEM